MEKPQKRVFLDVSEDVLMSFCVAGVALCDIRRVFQVECVCATVRGLKLCSTLYTPHFTLHTLHWRDPQRSDSRRLKSGEAHCDQELADDVRRRSLQSRAGRWGPAKEEKEEEKEKDKEKEKKEPGSWHESNNPHRAGGEQLVVASYNHAIIKDLDDGNVYRKIRYSMVKNHGFQWSFSEQTNSMGKLFEVSTFFNG